MKRNWRGTGRCVHFPCLSQQRLPPPPSEKIRAVMTWSGMLRWEGVKNALFLYLHRNTYLVRCVYYKQQYTLASNFLSLSPLIFQSALKAPVKVPPPVPTKPKGPGVVPYGKPGLNTGTFPKAKPHSQQPQAAQGRNPLPPSQSQTLPLPPKQDTPPAATVRPFTPELPSSKDTNLSKPQTLAASSIYSMYTQQPGSGKPFQPGVQGALNRAQTRPNGFISGKNIQFFFKWLYGQWHWVYCKALSKADHVATDECGHSLLGFWIDSILVVSPVIPTLTSLLCFVSKLTA